MQPQSRLDPEQCRAGYCSTHCLGSMKGFNTMTSAQVALWDLVEVAAYLKVPASSIYKMTGKKAGLRIPHIKLAGRLRFRQRDIDRWLELLSVSNLDTLEKVRKQARRTHGNYPQEETP